MKVTGMFPAITCNNSEELVKFVCDNFDFHVEHAPHAVMSKKESDRCYILKNETGVRFDVIQYDIEKPICGMCINVDNFDEALSIFENDGYKRRSDIVVIDNSKKVLLAKEKDITILLIQHYK